MARTSYAPLRLEAADADDLAVVSACLQDAVAKVGDFAYLPKTRRFAFVANRFVWEKEGRGRRGPHLRVRAGVHFDDVTRVRSVGLRREAKSAVVSILAVRFEGAEDGSGVVVIDLAGGGAISLDVECLSAHIRDVTEPWATRNLPRHDA